MLNYSYMETDSTKTLFIVDVDKGVTFTVTSSHPRFETIKTMLENHEDSRIIMRMVDPTAALGERFQYKRGVFYLDDEPVTLEKALIMCALDVIMEDHPDQRKKR